MFCEFGYLTVVPRLMRMENKALQVNEKFRMSNKSSRARMLLQRSVWSSDHWILESELLVECISELFFEGIVA